VPDPYYRTIGKRIRQAREQLGYSQEELAHEIGHNSATTISYFETGARKVSIADLHEIAGVLGLPVQYFLEEHAAPRGLFDLRAIEVPPTARQDLKDFLVFVEAHGSSAAVHVPGMAKLKPEDQAMRLLDWADVTGPPVRPRAVADVLKIPVYDWPFPDEISGAYAVIDEKICIGVNEGHPSVRQRFTVCHELGHHFGPEGNKLYVDFTHPDPASWLAGQRRQKLETRANAFAANMLMPAQWVRSDFSRDLSRFRALARRYDVSEQAMWFHLLNLGLVDEEDEALLL
jgi:Zn-dependent peptidase ImmA (M78 family)/transcriptional regulator with XRE-family HTH domain